MAKALKFSMENFEGFVRWPLVTGTFSQPLREDRLKDQDIGQFLQFGHGCHFADVKNYLRQGFIGMNSIIDFEMPDYGSIPINGIWCSPIEREKSWFGPYVIAINSWAFSNRIFMVFSKTITQVEYTKLSYYFVQHDMGLPLYGFSRDFWIEQKLSRFFEISTDKATKQQYFSPKEFVSYNIILTSPISTIGMSLNVLGHDRCIMKKCDGSIPKAKAEKDLDSLLTELKINYLVDAAQKIEVQESDDPCYVLNGGLPVYYSNNDEESFIRVGNYTHLEQFEKK